MQRQTSHLGRGHDQAGLVAPFIKLGLDAQAGGRARMADEVDDRLEGAERTAAPVFGDVAEEPVFNLVPLARARREMRDMDAQAEVVGQLLQGGLPPARAIAVAAAGIGRDVVVCENSAEQALRAATPAARPADARCAGLRRAPRQPSASASVAD